MSNFRYRGHDVDRPEIEMDLFLTGIPTGFDATGTIHLGNTVFAVKGVLSGATLAATVSYPLQFPETAARVPVSGTLSGSPGSGTLTVATRSVLIEGHYLTLSFALSPLSAADTPAPETLPPWVHMDGVTGFGYTKVFITVDTVLNKDESYSVRGTISVNQLRPALIQKTMPFSGVLTPGIPGVLNIFAAPPGSSPAFTATIANAGLSFQGHLSGLPTLSITGLYVSAK